MGKLIEFGTAKNALHQSYLASLGVADVMSWQVLSYTQTKYDHWGVKASPHIVIRHRGNGRVCVIHLVNGGVKGEDPTPRDKLMAHCQASIVGLSLRKEDNSSQEIEPWILYDTGMRVKLKSLTPGDHARVSVIADRFKKQTDALEINIEDAVDAYLSNSQSYPIVAVVRRKHERKIPS